MEYLIRTVGIGLMATAAMDVWGIARRPLLGFARPDYALLGRWVAYMPRGRFRHDPITASAPVRGERFIGWIAHYMIGITFAALITRIWGVAWLNDPTLGPPLLVGLGTVAAPFLLMQPGMGAGIAASRTPKPGVARLQSLISHIVFGFGLYVGGRTVLLLY